MGVFFGTDGLRGVVNDDLSYETAYKCGNALGGLYPNSKILIGRDTRGSGSFVTLAFATGAMNAGLDVVDVGVCPTAGISYLTTFFKYDFGVVISASHNSAEYNGIKIFDNLGKKLGDKREERLEKLFLKQVIVSFDKVGKYSYNPQLVLSYKKFLDESIQTSLVGKTIVLDCANGASFKLAPAVFRDKKAKVIAVHCKPDGLNINKGCGALNIQEVQKYVLKYKADMGFAFDGDSDRVIAVDEKGDIVDGDKMIYMLALDYLKSGKPMKCVVGTRHTNMGVERALRKKGIDLIRADIGDKYVSAKLFENDLLIGGEQSGHIIVRDKLITGDGVLNALSIAEICVKNNKKLSDFFDFELFKQKNINVRVCDKIRTINSAKLSKAIELEEKKLNENGRIMIHVSGTEPLIRIMVESLDIDLSTQVAERIAHVIEEINRENEDSID